jgi:peptidoglycan/xylan/chitin deacetylase (PgdA/CDA1 family)
LRLLAAAILTALCCLAATNAQAAAGRPSAATHRHPTVISLTFDDGTADQMAAARVLARYRLHGTFYIITGAVGAPHYMGRADLRTLAAAGDEIGGHTVSHLDLVNASAAEARRQVCAGRDILARSGFTVTSFAYPDGAYDAALERSVRGCGYSSARIAAGLAGPGCPGCSVTEHIPPRDPYAIRTPGQVDTSWTLAALKRAVTAARGHGGWLPLIFHHVCATGNCGLLSVPEATFTEFVAWLARQQAHGTVVATVGQVMGGAARPLVPARPAHPHDVLNPWLARSGPSAQTNPSLETPDRSGAPQCWMKGSYGDNTARWQRVRGAGGRWAERMTMTGYRNGGAELLQLFDLGTCSLPVKAGRSYQLSAWYTGTVKTQFSVYYRDQAGRWRYWTSSPYFAPASRWSKATWQTPPVPAGASGLSFGLSLFGNGSMTSGGYRFTLAPPDLVRMVAGWAVLAAVVLGGVSVAVRRVRARRRRRATGTGQRRTRLPAASGRRAS